MKVIMIILSSLLFGFSLACQDKRKDEVAKEFVKFLGDEKISLVSIRERWIVKLDKKEARETVGLIFQELRKQITSNGGQSKLTIVTYLSAVRNSARVKDLEISQEDRENTFLVLNSQNELIFPVVVKNNLIVAFSTLNKSGRHYILYWDK